MTSLGKSSRARRRVGAVTRHTDVNPVSLTLFILTQITSTPIPTPLPAPLPARGASAGRSRWCPGPGRESDGPLGLVRVPQTRIFLSVVGGVQKAPQAL